MDFSTIRKFLEHRVEFSPATGRPRFNELHNDVLFYVERLGGTAKTAELLGTLSADVELWIDEHYVPQPYADQIHSLTGAVLSAIQEPPTVVIGNACIWPPVRSSGIQEKLGLPPLAEDGMTILNEC